MSSQTLFVYGTLLFPAIMRRVVGRVLPSEPAVLRGYRRRRVRNEVYPGVLPSLGSNVKGKLCRGLDGATLCLLDAFEGPEFERRRVQVMTAGGLRGAFVYVLTRTSRRFATEDWVERDFASLWERSAERDPDFAPSAHSKTNRVISDRDPSRRIGPHVPVPGETYIVDAPSR